ncbi:hypothetical protein A1OE_945 [Candidatus Endolissoclinum faulkneri L2]|uniref:Uncharacterized protein n=1 Tax=Candidatus Endolissoclinum faulkneri L2 TaxID=1193729 RepID=K7Z501_9PROT|nr:hypothetical protein A1OE_945 [Candidatus Endolissoclinum faulkneri L2]
MSIKIDILLFRFLSNLSPIETILHLFFYITRNFLAFDALALFKIFYFLSISSNIQM